jgi:hypothetical protein
LGVNGRVSSAFKAIVTGDQHNIEVISQPFPHQNLVEHHLAGCAEFDMFINDHDSLIRREFPNRHLLAFCGLLRTVADGGSDNGECEFSRIRVIAHTVSFHW